MDDFLASHQYFGDNNVSVADICIAGILVWTFGLILSSAERLKYKNLSNWFTRVSELPAFKKIYG